MEVVSTNPVHSLELIGQLDSPQNVEIRARVEAFVDKVLFTEGTEVKEGDPLFLLDEKPFEERLAAAKGMLAEAKASLKKNQTDVARLKPLADKKAIPLQDLDNAVASVAVGEANVQSAEARVKSAEIDVGYCDVRAPVSGLIGARQVTVGSLVGKGQPTLLATISTLDPIWFYCAISEVDYLRGDRKARQGGHRLRELPVTLILADSSEYSELGKWAFLDRAVDVTTGTLRARAEFPNRDKTLRPGMFARVRITGKADEPAVPVPERALTELQGHYFVWVVGSDNKTTQRSVKAGETLGGDVLIQEGLKPGERIVVEGIQKVHEGATVKTVTAAEMAASLRTAKPVEAPSSK